MEFLLNNLNDDLSDVNKKLSKIRRKNMIFEPKTSKGPILISQLLRAKNCKRL